MSLLSSACLGNRSHSDTVESETTGAVVTEVCSSTQNICSTRKHTQAESYPTHLLLTSTPARSLQNANKLRRGGLRDKQKLHTPNSHPTAPFGLAFCHCVGCLAAAADLI